MKFPRCCSLNEVYDVVAGVISFSDLVTDIIVIYGYYTKNRLGFFWASLVIVLLAQLLYSFWFTMRYADRKPKLQALCIFFMSLPISPFISFIFCGTATQDTCCSKILRKMTLSVDDWHIPADASPLRVWFHRKLAKHFIFIMEAMCESFPNSIIQLIAIVYYNDKIDLQNDIFSVINIISIIISMLSVGSKSLVLSALIGGIEYHTFIYNWLSNILDFFGIFFIVSWVFYRPNDEFTTLGYFYIYKSLIAVLPPVILIGIALCGRLYYHFFEQWSDSGCIKNCFIGICWFIPCFTLFVGGCVISYMLLEILLFSYFSFVIYMECVKRRFKHKNSQQINFWKGLFEWIDESKSLFDTGFKYNDAIVRICIINDVLINNKHIKNVNRGYNSNHAKLTKYLDSQQAFPQCFENVKLSDTRAVIGNYYTPTYNTLHNHDARFWNRLWRIISKPFHQNSSSIDWTDIEEVASCFFFTFLTFFCLPCYLISRIITFMFPLIIFIAYFDIFKHLFLGSNDNDLPYFQISMTVVYLIILISWIIFSVFFVWRKQYYRWHILPFQIKINLSQSSEFKYDSEFLLRTRIEPYYENMRYSQNNKEIICQCMGRDIGSIINSYLPQFTTDVRYAILNESDNDIETKLKQFGICWDEAETEKEKETNDENIPPL